MKTETNKSFCLERIKGFMKKIMKSERRVEEEGKRYLLKYELVSNVFPEEEGEGSYYGIIVEQFVWLQEKKGWMLDDSEQVKGFSESLKESMLFFEKVVKGNTMPVSLGAIVDDWKCAFYPNNEESA